MGYTIGDDGVIVRTPEKKDMVEKKKYWKAVTAAVVFFVLTILMGGLAYYFYMESVYWKSYRYTMYETRAMEREDAYYQESGRDYETGGVDTPTAESASYQVKSGDNSIYVPETSGDTMAYYNERW